MVDLIALSLSHGLLALAVWRLLRRDDLDDEAGADTSAHPHGPYGSRAKRNVDRASQDMTLARPQPGTRHGRKEAVGPGMADTPARKSRRGVVWPGAEDGDA